MSVQNEMNKLIQVVDQIETKYALPKRASLYEIDGEDCYISNLALFTTSEFRKDSLLELNEDLKEIKDIYKELCRLNPKIENVPVNVLLDIYKDFI